MIFNLSLLFLSVILFVLVAYFLGVGLSFILGMLVATGIITAGVGIMIEY